MAQEDEGLGLGPAPREGDEHHHRPTRVLLVEEDPRTAMMIDGMLRAGGERDLVVIHAQELSAAVRELHEHGASCVLIDLPSTASPVAALERLAEAGSDAPVIVFTDRADGPAAVTALRAGAQDLLGRSQLSAALLARAVHYAVERKRAEVELALQALHDPLTALPNRVLFLDRLRGALDRSRRTGVPVVVLFLDVDDFKGINDSLGHGAGDRLMTLLADRFRALLRPMDTVARFGGDEFTFLFEGLEGEHEAARVAQRLGHSASQPLELDTGEISVSVSIGVTIVTDPTSSIDEIIRRADQAMYQAKQYGGARFEMAASLPDPGSERPGWLRGERPGEPPSDRPGATEAELHRAVRQSQLRVHYQPQVSLRDRTGLHGFEALLRWEHPQRGLIEPGQFIGLAERTGLIVPIGEWVLSQALEQATAWRRSRPGISVSVNLSRRQLVDPGLTTRLGAMIAGHDPRTLCLEIAERTLQQDPSSAARQLSVLHEMGVTLAIDDFGTGGSTAGSLQRMPVDVLKIDRSLVCRLDAGSGGGGGVGAAVEVGHALGLTVVAEGVETDGQLAALRSLGCDGAQGFLFSKPLSEDCVRSILTSSS